MRHAVRLLVCLLALLSLSCKVDKKALDEALLSDEYAGYSVKDMWEYQNEDGLCDMTEWFGDSPNGCLKSIQIIRFKDRTTFYSMTLGPNPTTTWTWSGYIWSSGSFERTLDLGSGISFQITGSMSGDEPNISITYDSNASYVDTPSLDIELEKQELL